jgi:soluble lytic murein transglycosylase-like protein
MRAYAVTAGLLLFFSSVPAQAQIYSWRDATGTLVLSNRQLSLDAKTYAVPDTTVFRAARPIPGTSAHDRYEPLIQTHAAANGLPVDLVRAVIQMESGFDSRAQSPKGAMGPMQLMPATAVDLGVRDPYDADQNIRGGSAYLRRLLDRFDGDETLALADYNAGPEAVRRARDAL